MKFEFYLDAYYYCIKNGLDHHTRMKKTGFKEWTIELNKDAELGV